MKYVELPRGHRNFQPDDLTCRQLDLLDAVATICTFMKAGGTIDIQCYRDDKISIELYTRYIPIFNIKLLIPRDSKVAPYEAIPVFEYGYDGKIPINRPGKWLDYIISDLWPKAKLAEKQALAQKHVIAADFAPIDDSAIFT